MATVSKAASAAEAGSRTPTGGMEGASSKSPAKHPRGGGWNQKATRQEGRQQDQTSPKYGSPFRSKRSREISHGYQSNRLLARLQMLLGRLQPDVRRTAIRDLVPQELRVALEDWMMQQCKKEHHAGNDHQDKTHRRRTRDSTVPPVDINSDRQVHCRSGGSRDGDPDDVGSIACQRSVRRRNSVTNRHTRRWSCAAEDRCAANTRSCRALRTSKNNEKEGEVQEVEMEKGDEHQEDEETMEDVGDDEVGNDEWDKREQECIERHVRPLALEDADVEDLESTDDFETRDCPKDVGSEGRGTASVRGLQTRKHGRTIYYMASICIKGMRIFSRKTKDLTVALDHLAFLSTASQRIRAKPEPFEISIRDTFAHLGRDIVGLGQSDDVIRRLVHRMSLTFTLRLRRCFWIGRSRKLATPTLTCLDAALATWRRFSDLPCSAAKGFSVLWQWSPSILEADWRSLCEMLADEWSKVGKDGDKVRKRLLDYEVASASHRERMMERWNSTCMQREDRGRMPNHHQGRDHRRKQNRERKAMEQADGRAEFHQQWHDHIMLRRIVVRWNSLRGERQAVADQRFRRSRREQAAKARHRLRIAREATRRHQAERADRWKRMNRRDITMADLLTGQQT
eukprot:TRINITY_DN42478_c0_g1_i1.p1 TRINITY_DN42478_c0_g1~~TRINITY_DN42478_c0_g1_i1.p1  ORF type:complete len:712 (-),score=88.51 TRINITY_DN42478_c0_g1_i1:23-1900(-)